MQDKQNLQQFISRISLVRPVIQLSQPVGEQLVRVREADVRVAGPGTQIPCRAAGGRARPDYGGNKIREIPTVNFEVPENGSADDAPEG